MLRLYDFIMSIRKNRFLVKKITFSNDCPVYRTVNLLRYR